jgi:hypothetical protein
VIADTEPRVEFPAVMRKKLWNFARIVSEHVVLLKEDNVEFKDPSGVPIVSRTLRHSVYYPQLSNQQAVVNECQASVKNNEEVSEPPHTEIREDTLETSSFVKSREAARAQAINRLTNETMGKPSGRNILGALPILPHLPTPSGLNLGSSFQKTKMKKPTINRKTAKPLETSCSSSAALAATRYNTQSNVTISLLSSSKQGRFSGEMVS